MVALSFHESASCIRRTQRRSLKRLPSYGHSLVGLVNGMTQAMAAAALNCGAEYGVYMMPIRGKDKATIFPKSLELGMDACDVFVGMTTASGAAIYNNHLKELINQKKLREVSICLRNIDNFTRGGALADYEAVYADGEKLQAIWRGHKMAHITTPAGTDLYMEMNQMEPIIECGIARNPGDAMAWSDGEVSLGPVIDTTHGKLVIDGPICYYAVDPQTDERMT